ncbi:MAG: methyltransferase domain-containing protein [Bryobacteraceae bacterium]|nr:methyltransferase domain-containing protein [Bryobacteraceae bacterium]
MRPPRAAGAAEVKRFFEVAAADERHYPAEIDPRIEHVKQIADHLGPLDGRVIADLGCGKGRFARVYQERFPAVRLVSVDIAEAMVTSAPGARCCATLTALPFRTAAFDGAYATESLEHAVDVELAVSEVCRIVKPGGHIAIIDKNREHWGRFETPDWEQWFGREQMERLLRRHCRDVASNLISYWEDVPPDGLFVIWKAVR